VDCGMRIEKQQHISHPFAEALAKARGWEEIKYPLKNLAIALYPIVPKLLNC